jgi:hypothetical protein
LPCFAFLPDIYDCFHLFVSQGWHASCIIVDGVSRCLSVLGRVFNLQACGELESMNQLPWSEFYPCELAGIAGIGG